MSKKGLLEWKILAAVFAVLIVASSAILGDTNLGNVFNYTGGEGGGWPNPFGSLFAPVTGNANNSVVIEITVGRISLDFESPVNITSGETEISNFEGSADFDFEGNYTMFIQSGTGVVVRKGIDVTSIEGASVKEIIIESADYTVSTEGTNTTGSGERIEIRGFSGTVRASSSLVLDGIVSSVGNGKWSIG